MCFKAFWSRFLIITNSQNLYVYKDLYKDIFASQSFICAWKNYVEDKVSFHSHAPKNLKVSGVIISTLFCSRKLDVLGKKDYFDDKISHLFHHFMSQVHFQNLLLNKFTTGISKKPIPPPQKILKNWKYLRGRWVTRNKHFSDYRLNLIYPTKSWTACVADLPSVHWHWATKKSKQGGRGRRVRKGISSTGVFENSCGISMCLGFWPCWNFQGMSLNFVEFPGLKLEGI